MKKETKIKVDSILGKPIFFDKKTKGFVVEIGELEFKADTLERLKLNVRDSHICEVDENIYYDSTGDLIQTKVVRVTPDFIKLSDYRAGIGINPIISIDNFRKDIFPLTEKNKKIYKENQNLRNKGWNLINQAKKLIENMDMFPRDYFKKKLKK